MDRQRWLVITLLLACFSGLFLICFGRALRGDVQFGFRDAGHFYYPLYKRVQTEWQAGRWPPLWEPEENAGMPLLGNPTAAVLYPGKLIYGLLPYPWAARLYIMAHIGLAFATMLAAMRSWQPSWTGSGLAALTYTFGAPVLFQYCNVIYLVGAAWLPLGFMAVDRWIRLGSRPSLLILAIVLAMQTLGGDPQAAYLLGLCGCGYAILTAPTTDAGCRSGQPRSRGGFRADPRASILVDLPRRPPRSGGMGCRDDLFRGVPSQAPAHGETDAHAPLDALCPARRTFRLVPGRPGLAGSLAPAAVAVDTGVDDHGPGRRGGPGRGPGRCSVAAGRRVHPGNLASGRRRPP